MALYYSILSFAAAAFDRPEPVSLARSRPANAFCGSATARPGVVCQ